MYKQIAEYDCVLACIASLINKPIEYVFPKIFRDEVEEAKGIHGDNVDKAFDFAGMTPDEHYWPVYLNNPNSNYLYKIIRGRKAFIQVASLNYETGSHWVYWDGAVLHDPSNKQIYKWLNHCKVEVIFLFDGVL